ncbi:MAG: hypothetical protein HC892_00360 [Saprospiraceae bacterium]|nr:hypothetical protein [Saprospiraceae bacterium]
MFKDLGDYHYMGDCFVGNMCSEKILREECDVVSIEYTETHPVEYTHDYCRRYISDEELEYITFFSEEDDVRMKPEEGTLAFETWQARAHQIYYANDGRC